MLLDLSNFNTANVTNMSYMFHTCSKLKTIYVFDKWNTENVTFSENMFYRCDILVGGSGTTYDTNYIDVSYARVDRGTTKPGYFTYKSIL